MTESCIGFTREEMARVLESYDLGRVISITPFRAGNPLSPKALIACEQGRFILKRRPRGKDDPHRIALAHSIRKLLSCRDYPVVTARHTLCDDKPFLYFDGNIYELFRFIDGGRYDRSPVATEEAGRQLAAFHGHLASCHATGELHRRCFHDSPAVRTNLAAIGNGDNGNNALLRRCACELEEAYSAAAARVNATGFDRQPIQIVHGDWHPGNILFADGRVLAVLDMDSIKIAPPATDLANGILQFSIVAGGTDPARWPDDFDCRRVERFMQGYRSLMKPDGFIGWLPDLMVETLIAEAVLPVAATGSFGRMCGASFLAMVARKCRWIETRRDELAAVMA